MITCILITYSVLFDSSAIPEINPNNSTIITTNNNTIVTNNNTIITTNNSTITTTNNNTTSDIISISTAKNDSKFELTEPLPQQATLIMTYKINDVKSTPEYRKKIYQIFSIPVIDINDDYVNSENGDKLHFFENEGFYYTTSDRYDDKVPDNLPEEQEAINIAEQFLKTHDLLPDGFDSVWATTETIGVYFPANKTASGYTVAWTIDFSRTLDGIGVDGAGEKLNVVIGDNGKILGVHVSYRDVSSYQIKAVKPVDQAYTEMINGNATKSTATTANKVLITEVYLCYWAELAGYGQEYFEPYYIFKGDTVFNDKITKDGYMALVKAVQE